MQKTRRIICVILALLLCGAAVLAYAAGGTDDDPLVTLDYILNVYKPAILNQGKTHVADALNAYETAVTNTIQTYYAKLQALDGKLTPEAKQAVIQELIQELQTAQNPDTPDGVFHAITLDSGKQLIGGEGFSCYILSGAAVTTGTVLDLTTGTELSTPTALTARHRYLVLADGSGGIEASNGTVTVYCAGTYTMAEGGTYHARYTAVADGLYELGLFLGGSNGYDLEREPNRLESIVMMIRLLGEEAAALSYSIQHPFTDIPAWSNHMADKFVAYAYDHGYAFGYPGNVFGATDNVMATQYMTFVLRAMGYDDSAGDFQWNKALDKAVAIGMLTQTEAAQIEAETFYRDTMVFVSYRALKTCVKGSTDTLIELLVERGVVSAEKAISVMNQLAAQFG